MAISSSISSQIASMLSGTGLTSTLDTQSLISSLVSIAQQPLTALQTQASAYQSQISLLGGLASSLSSLETATQGLADNGALGVTATSTNTAFTATPGTSAQAGSYAISVTSLASAAKWRSGAFASGDAVEGGTLTLSVNGTSYPSTGITVSDGESLSQLASSINASGAPVSASVLNDGTSNYLSITASGTGYTGSNPSSALQVSFAASPSDSGSSSNLDPTAQAWSQLASNAVFSIDGLQFTRQSNTVTDALPGTTLQLKQVSPTDSTGVPIPETLTLVNDTSATQQNLQAFVSAYNSLMTLVQAQTNTSSSTNVSTSLAGNESVRSFQQTLETMISSAVSGIGGVNSLASLGIQTQMDGTLSIDSSVLSTALAQNPSAVNTIFSAPATGIYALTSNLVTTYSAPVTGIFSQEQSGLQQEISSTQNQEATAQNQINAYQQSLVTEFSNMESIVGKYKSIGSYLTQQSNLSSTSTIG